MLKIQFEKLTTLSVPVLSRTCSLYMCLWCKFTRPVLQPLQIDINNVKITYQIMRTKASRGPLPQKKIQFQRFTDSENVNCKSPEKPIRTRLHKPMKIERLIIHLYIKKSLYIRDEKVQLVKSDNIFAIGLLSGEIRF